MYYVTQSKQVLQIIFKNIERHKYNMFKTPNFKALKIIIREQKDKLPEFEGKHILLTYVFDISSELINLDENEAIVSNVKDSFGFVKNTNYPQGIYFSKHNINFEPKIGDIVELGEVIEKKQGVTALSIKYKTNIMEKHNI